MAQREVWVGAHSGDHRVALAWVRRSDELLIDAGMADANDGVSELARMFREAVAKRGHGPDELRVADLDLRDRLRTLLGDEVAIEAGFDPRARGLADAAISAIEVAFGAEAMLARDARNSQVDLMQTRMHETVEAQLAADDPPEARRALDRLQSGGMDRDAAVHAIAGAFMHLMHRVLETGEPFDPSEYAAVLDALEVEGS